MSTQTTMYADMSRDEREKLMAAQCLRTEIVDYSRTLSDDETVAEQNSYTREAMGLEALEAEFKQVQASFRSRIKAIKDVMTQSLKVISTGKRQLNGKLFLFPDHQSNEMRYFDVYGELVNKRPLIPQERQTKLFIGADAEGAKHGEDNGHLTEDANFEIVPASPGHTEEETAGPVSDPKEDKKPAKRAAKRSGKTKSDPKPEPGTDINEKVKGMTASHAAAKEKTTNKPDYNPNNNIPAGAPGPDEEGFNDEAGALEVERKINSDEDINPLEDDADNLPD